MPSHTAERAERQLISDANATLTEGGEEKKRKRALALHETICAIHNYYVCSRRKRNMNDDSAAHQGALFLTRGKSEGYLFLHFGTDHFKVSILIISLPVVRQIDTSL